VKVSPLPILSPEVRAMAELEEELEEELEKDVPLFNDRGTGGSYNAVRECPEHRIMIYLKAQGKSNGEIADATGYSPTSVSMILRLPWARERLLAIIREQGLPLVQQLLAGAAADSIMTLIAVRDDSKSRSTDKINASNSLLDRFLGKPLQKVETAEVKSFSGHDAAALDEELRLLEVEEKRLVGKN